MLSSPLYVIDLSDAPHVSDGLRTIGVGEVLKIPSVDIEGVPHTPVFSSLARLRTVLSAEQKYIAMNGRQLLELVRDSCLILNPGSPYGKQFLPQETVDLLSGDIFRGYSTRTVKEATKVLLGQPAQYPTHITDALKERFRGLRTVKAAYLAQCLMPESGEPPHTLVGVVVSGEFRSVVTTIMDTIKRVAKEGDIVDVVRIDDPHPEGVAEYLLKETQPFYKRRRSFF